MFQWQARAAAAAAKEEVVAAKEEEEEEEEAAIVDTHSCLSSSLLAKATLTIRTVSSSIMSAFRPWCTVTIFIT